MKKRGISFLNKTDKEGEASIGWYVSDYGKIIISDCNRKVSLEIYASDKDDYSNAVYKINTLLKELCDCKASLTEYGKQRGFVK